MKRLDRILWIAWMAVWMLVPATTVLAQESSFDVTGRYTAQRRPRIAVFEFVDTNSSAVDQKYGPSVQAMLVTFLKRKSQFVVVERQRLGEVLKEWKRTRFGETSEDPNVKQLLEKIDVIVLGNVTMLDSMTVAETADSEDSDGAAGRVEGQRIEIDVKLLSRADGRIIAAAQRSGPISCLRSIVERLGIALEQEYLRPYYGKITFKLTEPQNVQIFLTPILLDTALDEEKPPVERGSTILVGRGQDTIDPWTTDPTAYTIENLLSGWYSMRLERPGYEELGTDNPRWEARDFFGEVKVFDRQSSKPLDRLPSEIKRFVVRVDPLRTEVIDGDALKLAFRQEHGSFAPRVKRQYLDQGYSHTPQRVLLFGKDGIELNRYEDPGEFAEDESCDLFFERKPNLLDYGTTYITAGETFNFDTFKGGKLIIEDYRGEALPVGQYQMALWEPHYHVQSMDIMVRDGDGGKEVQTALTRETASVELATTGAKKPHKLVLEGIATKFHTDMVLDFLQGKIQNGLPVDAYTVKTNVPGLTGWQQSAELLSQNMSPPIYDPELDAMQEKEKEAKIKAIKEEAKRRGKRMTAAQMRVTMLPPFRPAANDEEVEDTGRPGLTAKTRLTLGGRLSALSSLPDPMDHDFFIDRHIERIIDALLHAGKKVDEDEEGRARARSRAVLRSLASALPQVAPPSGPGAPAGVATAFAAAAQDASTAKAANQPEVPPLPSDPEKLRALLARHLETVDLLLLDNKDMMELQESPEVAAVVRRYVKAGGALFAFVSESGDYEAIVGAPLDVEVKGKRTSRFEISQGEISGFELPLDPKKKRMKVKAKRMLPQIATAAPWRVVAFTGQRKDPRIVEWSGGDQGGYVMVWGDAPASFRGRWGGKMPRVEKIRAAVEKRVLGLARYMMYQRYDETGEELSRLKQAGLR